MADGEHPKPDDVNAAKWHPDIGPFSPHQDMTPPGYDSAKSPFDPENVAVLREAFASYPGEPYMMAAMLAGQHFGALENSPRGFSKAHHDAVFWGPAGRPGGSE